MLATTTLGKYKRVQIISWIFKIYSPTAFIRYCLLLKSKAIHAFILFLLFFVFKAINIPLKDPKVLIIIRILTVILPLFGLGNR